MAKHFPLFQMNGKHYELVATAKDFGQSNQGKMGVFRQQGTQLFGVMPMVDLSSFLNSNSDNEDVLQGRLNLYKKRFIDRTDVYAHRYYNKKAARDMYAPVVPFKNGRPLLNAWIPLTDTALKEHLTGKQFLGFYPMLPDNTTKYLVIDIDGHHQGNHWQEITTSICKICEQHHLPALTELSQSGHGCHLWIFFQELVPASKARQLGDTLLKATMAVNPNLSFSAFDRMFPSQDIIGSKQIGNLIAGPLQGERRRQGKSVFIDHSFQPIPNQWQALSNIELIDEKKLDQLVSNLKLQSNFQLFDDKESQINLLKEPLNIDQPLTIIRSNELYIDKSDLKKQQIMQLKWFASFQNPEFYEKQHQRVSTFNVPRIINVFDENNQYLLLPRGLEDRLTEMIPHITWIDKTIKGRKIHTTFLGTLRAEQQIAFKTLLHHTTGVLAARTGFGKTVIAAKIIAHLSTSTLILVHDKELAKQWIERLNQFLKVTDKPFITELTPTGRKRQKKVIGSYFGAKHNRSGIIDVATVQSFKEDKISQDILNQYGLVISDEVHHDAAYTYEQIIKQLHCKYLYGLSATPFRRDGQDPIITMRFGAIRYQTSPIDEKTLLKVKRLVIPRFTSLGITNLEIANNDINKNYEAILHDDSRNRSLIKDIEHNLNEKRHILVLTNRIEHLHQLAKLLNKNQPAFLLYGEQTDALNTAVIQHINNTKGPYVVIATGKYAGEGLDIATIDTLILAMPHSWKGSSEQYLGRMQRNLNQKPEIRVYDYVDMFVPMLAKMYHKRQKTYHYLHYQIVNDQYSQQSGIKFLEGNYQDPILDSIKDAHELTICANQISKFILEQVLMHSNEQCKINILTNEITSYQKELLKKYHVLYTRYDRNLPNCLIVDKDQLWLSSDAGFNQNKGITVQLNQPELAKQFVRMLFQTIEQLDT
ncbi:MAG: DEAD/DEAH box helicase [Lentilactobacillus diolivorans]|jgi:superfamily II DNA or RNA helicase|nr:DEAD/DEAH box helicase [Lentilactobacillus diolivorans]RRG03333.1 MAG: restriction endonuclease subunit R [Lactobacillus sp.]